ncbi:MAG: TetR/AcrR family transcriptional regulator [Kiloniellaceae bacterium]
MPTGKGTAARRRTQAERSTATQHALLLAARKAIYDLGYSRTTVAEIAKRAGVSRGAQIHHYPSKQKLMLAVADFIFSEVEDEAAEIAARLGAGEGDVDGFIRDLWTRVFRPAHFNPIMELANAARTDPALGALLAARWARLIDTYNTIWSTVLHRAPRGGDEMATILNLTLSLLRGMAFQRTIDDSPGQFYDDQLGAWAAIVKGVIEREPALGSESI